MQLFFSLWGNPFSAGARRPSSSSSGLTRLASATLWCLWCALFCGLLLALPHPARAAQIYAWGGNTSGELGNNSLVKSSVPVAVTLPGGVSAMAVSAGAFHSLALGNDGKVYAWGANEFGQLGNASMTISLAPVAVTLASGVTATAVSAGDYYTLALGNDGNVYSWGTNDMGQLGDGSTTSSNVPVAITLASGVDAVAVGAGQGHSLAIGSDGKIYAWGRNIEGQLGDGSTTDSLVPVAITLPGGASASAVDASGNHSLAIGSDGNVYSWGNNSYAELGDGTTVQSDVPVAVMLASGVSPTAVSAGIYQSLAAGSDGKFYGWGNNGNGQLGNGTTESNSTVPRSVTLPGGVNVTAVNAGGFHSLAIGSDGKVYAAGYNNSGELGNGNTVQSPVFVAVTLPGGMLATQVSGGDFHSLALGEAVSAPTITSFTPASGIIGTGVFITGTGFIGTSSVKFNGTTAVNYIVNSATQITTEVPTGATTGNIMVTTPGGSVTTAGVYTVQPFTPTSSTFAWTNRAPAAPPTIRNGQAMSYDSARGVSVLFGGFNGTYSNDTWEWNGTSWTQKTFNGAASSPSPRGYHAMSYDSARGVSVLFGGVGDTGELSDTWEWNGTAWTQRTINRATGNPSPRYYSGMSYDSARGVSVLFGGSSQNSLNDTWEWNGTAWTQKTITDAPGNPSPRYGFGIVYDNARGVSVLFGGSRNGNVSGMSDTWEWNGTAWTQRTINGGAGTPSPRYYHAMSYDSARGVSVLFGGISSNTLNDTWEWNGIAWTQRTINGATGNPSPRFLPTMVYDSARGVSVLFGGINGGNLNDTWEYGASPLPTIISFTPASGTVATNVVITGTSFTGTSSVKFNGTTALNYIVNSATQITTEVPTGATTGKITVTTPNGTGTSAANFMVTASATSGAIITEFRFRGPAGIADEYVELYNTTGAPLDISGWSIKTGTVSVVLSANAPANTVIPARGHFLFTGTTYSLGSYGASDTGISANIADNAGVALVNATGTTIDAVGFAGTGTNLIEGSGIIGAPNTNGQYAFMRRFNGQSPVDTGDNAADFLLLSTDGLPVAGTNGQITAQLGSPNPENLASPVNINAQIGVRVLDANFGPNAAPNRVRNGSGNGGSLVFRRILKNNGTQPLSRIRLLVTDITGQVSPVVAGQADVRLTSQADENVAVAGQGTVLVYGTTLEAPSNLPTGTGPTTVGGGGIGSSVNYGIVLTTPLQPNEERAYGFNVQVAKTGSFFVNINLLGK